MMGFTDKLVLAAFAVLTVLIVVASFLHAYVRLF